MALAVQVPAHGRRPVTSRAAPHYRNARPPDCPRCRPGRTEKRPASWTRMRVFSAPGSATFCRAAHDADKATLAERGRAAARAGGRRLTSRVSVGGVHEPTGASRIACSDPLGARAYHRQPLRILCRPFVPTLNTPQPQDTVANVRDDSAGPAFHDLITDPRLPLRCGHALTSSSAHARLLLDQDQAAPVDGPGSGMSLRRPHGHVDAVHCEAVNDGTEDPRACRTVSATSIDAPPEGTSRSYPAGERTANICDGRHRVAAAVGGPRRRRVLTIRQGRPRRIRRRPASFDAGLLRATRPTTGAIGRAHVSVTGVAREPLGP